MISDMIFELEEIIHIWGIPIGDVLHVGAHRAEELESYSRNGFNFVTWVEAQPQLAKELLGRLDKTRNRVINIAAWDTNGELKSLKITNNSQSSSLLNMKTHIDAYPDISVTNEIQIEAKRLDSILPQDSKFSLINLDIQGAELNALKGLGDILTRTDVIYCEVNRKQLYEGCALVNDIDSYLKQFNFRRVSTKWYIRAGWGDAVYIKDYRLSFSCWRKAKLSEITFYSPQARALVRKILKKMKRNT